MKNNTIAYLPNGDEITASIDLEYSGEAKNAKGQSVYLNRGRAPDENGEGERTAYFVVYSNLDENGDRTKTDRKRNSIAYLDGVEVIASPVLDRSEYFFDKPVGGERVWLVIPIHSACFFRKVPVGENRKAIVSNQIAYRCSDGKEVLASDTLDSLEDHLNGKGDFVSREIKDNGKPYFQRIKKHSTDSRKPDWRKSPIQDTAFLHHVEVKASNDLKETQGYVHKDGSPMVLVRSTPLTPNRRPHFRFLTVGDRQKGMRRSGSGESSEHTTGKYILAHAALAQGNKKVTVEEKIDGAVHASYRVADVTYYTPEGSHHSSEIQRQSEGYKFIDRTEDTLERSATMDWHIPLHYYILDNRIKVVGKPREGNPSPIGASEMAYMVKAKEIIDGVEQGEDDEGAGYNVSQLIEMYDRVKLFHFDYEKGIFLNGELEVWRGEDDRPEKESFEIRLNTLFGFRYVNPEKFISGEYTADGCEYLSRLNKRLVIRDDVEVEQNCYLFHLVWRDDKGIESGDLIYGDPTDYGIPPLARYVIADDGSKILNPVVANLKKHYTTNKWLRHKVTHIDEDGWGKNCLDYRNSLTLKKILEIVDIQTVTDKGKLKYLDAVNILSQVFSIEEPEKDIAKREKEIIRLTKAVEIEDVKKELEREKNKDI